LRTDCAHGREVGFCGCEKVVRLLFNHGRW
jgi:hypothetical protein